MMRASLVCLLLPLAAGDAELADAGEDGPYAQYAVASEAWKALRELWGGAHALLVLLRIKVQTHWNNSAK